MTGINGGKLAHSALLRNSNKVENNRHVNVYNLVREMENLRLYGFFAQQKLRIFHLAKLFSTLSEGVGESAAVCENLDPRKASQCVHNLPVYWYFP